MNSYLKLLPEGTVWPNPTDPGDVQWRLRHGTPTKTDLLIAASVMSAYRELIRVTGRRRTEVVRMIRDAQ